MAQENVFWNVYVQEFNGRVVYTRMRVAYVAHYFVQPHAAALVV